ncbi:MAG: hypothetical protein F4Z65_03925 [Acidobacteria bacterium]|nr:hypothetical protein [Acidobacteriota bacterium]MYA45879.1 hypothetical protein [Acidobacteriota bacterium]MYI40121.1 hypothetical protein [Acidobacteriota bacterium]
MFGSSWRLHPEAHALTVGTFLDAMMDLGSAAERLRDKESLFDPAGGGRALRAVVRQMSVPLRKLCLDGDGVLLRKTIGSLAFHPLGGPKSQYRRVAMSWRSRRQEWVLGFADGGKRTVVVPETEHEIEIGRLYGVDFVENGWCSIHTPFDLTAHPVPMEEWLETKVLQVNSVSYTIREALRLVADYEGAHASELPAWNAVGVNPEAMDRGRKMKYRLANSVYFGCLSYVQLVTLYTALYLVGKIQQLLANSANTLAGVDAAPVERSIRHLPTNLVLRAQIINGTQEMIVVGKSDVPGNRRRHPVYRLWSGSPEWDAPPPTPP